MTVKLSCALLICSAVTGAMASQIPSSQAKVRDYVQHAEQLGAEGKEGAAGRAYAAALAIDPQNVEAQANWGVILFFQHRCKEAKKHLAAALRVEPKLGNIRALLGVCQERLGQTKAAQISLDAALKNTKRQNVRYFVNYNLLQIYYGEGDLARAAETAQTLLKRHPHNLDLIYMIYRIHADIADRARNLLAVLAPDSARMHQIMAEEFINAGDATDAITQYRRALAKAPNSPGLSYELAEAIMEESLSAQSLDKASVLLRKTLSLEPNNAGAIAKLGEIALIRDQSGIAKKQFTRALAINPDTQDALNGMATIASRRGQETAAIQYLLRAARVEPLDARLHYRLSRLYSSLHEKAAADRELKRFMALNRLLKKTQLLQQRDSMHFH